MADYNSGGFHQGDDGTIFGNPDGSAQGSITDYDNWDWKQIKAAVYGMSSGVANAANEAHARSVADPQSLLDAANAFYHVQRTLEGVTKSLVDQAKALAGDNGPWSGGAADAFIDMMTTFSRQVKANADVLSGGSTGDHSVPHQLANNAIAFQSAQNKLAEIDSWYADQAVKMGVTPMDNGLIPISQKPELVAMMNEDMRAVLKNLAHSYQVTTDTIVTPTPVNSPTDNPNGSGNDGSPDPDLGLDGTDNPSADLGGTGDLSDLSGFPDTGLDSGAGTGDGIGDLGDVAGLDTSGDATPYPGDLSGLDGTGLDSTGLDGTGLDGAGLGDLGLDSLDPSALDAALNPTAFPGLTGLGGLGSGGLGSADESSLGGLSTADPTAFGDTGLDDGLGALTGSGLDSGLTDGLSADSLAPSQLATSSGMPYMPGMGGGMGAGGAGLSSEPTDASGLLDASGDPWEGEALTGGDEVGSDLGTAAGGEGLTTAGMPYMPGMGGGMGAGGGSRDGVNERTDASGLLDPSTQPWNADEESGDDEVGSLTGAAPGVPYLPGMGGMGTAGGGRDGVSERTDASGLLDPSTQPWNADEESGDDEVGSLSGAAPGVPYLPGFGVLGAAVRGAGNRAAGTSGEDAGESAQAEGVTAPDTRTAVTAVAVGSDGLPLPTGDDAVVGRPVADDGEEDLSVWDTGASAFVPLLWSVPRGRNEEETDPAADEQSETEEARNTWEPDRTAPEATPGATAGVLRIAACGDGGPEPEEPEEEPEEEEQEEEEPAARNFTDLLVQDESTWGSVPGDSAGAF
ncbi:WXG100 family type VII secretion target [Streptomyces sp. NPDC051665]|uniref:WXG100 family type VII secretion target n=1 Tax=Streptomyces sp. NPDC051665 TaxID=3154647 RepID=UPI00342B0055